MSTSLHHSLAARWSFGRNWIILSSPRWYLAWNGVLKLRQSPEFTFEANIYQYFKSFEQIIFRRCSSSDWRPSCGAKFPVQFLAPDGSLTVDFVLIYSNMLKYILTYQNKFFSSKEDQEHLTVCEGTKISEGMSTSRTRKNWLTSPTAWLRVARRTSGTRRLDVAVQQHSMMAVAAT